MNFDQVLELVKVVSDSELTAFQYEEGNQKITMQAGGVLQNDFAPANNHTAIMAETNPAQAPFAQEKADAEKESGISKNGNLVTSPLVGRFYAAPAEDAEAFVKVGDTVKKGQTLAIVEAMKLMNEIESEYDGVITEILADNGQGVEYGQPLFRIAG